MKELSKTVFLYFLGFFISFFIGIAYSTMNHPEKSFWKSFVTDDESLGEKERLIEFKKVLNTDSSPRYGTAVFTEKSTFISSNLPKNYGFILGIYEKSKGLVRVSAEPEFDKNFTLLVQKK